MILANDIRKLRQGEPLLDYILEDYGEGKRTAQEEWHSETMFRYFLREHGMLIQAEPIIASLKRHLGENKTVWGVKYGEDREPAFELYFYNHCRNTGDHPMSVSNLTGALRGVASIPYLPDERLPYIMCSIEWTKVSLESGVSDGFRIYLAGAEPDGISYLPTENGYIRENCYWFYSAEEELAEVEQKLQRSLHAGYQPLRLLSSSLRKCYTICYAEKRHTDALYYSRVNTGRLNQFAKKYLRGPIADLLASHAERFTQTKWDIGYDFRRKREDDDPHMIKVGIYGVF